jgi:hypothetical protein
MSECSKYNKLDTCPSPPVCQWLNKKCKNFNLVDLNNSFVYKVNESMSNMTDNDNSDLILGTENTLKNIQIIQMLESDIYDKLLKNDTTQQMSEEEKQSALNELSNLSTIKINLYDSIKDIYDTSVDTMSTAKHSVKEQLGALKIVEEELKNSSTRMGLTEEDNINTARKIEINRYYEEKYNDHTGFIKYLIIFILSFLFVYILYKRLLINNSIYMLLLFILILAGAIILGKYYYKMLFRSNMQYQEYVFPYANKVGSTSIDSNIVNPWENPTNNCSLNLNNSTDK